MSRIVQQVALTAQGKGTGAGIRARDELTQITRSEMMETSGPGLRIMGPPHHKQLSTTCVTQQTQVWRFSDTTNKLKLTFE